MILTKFRLGPTVCPRTMLYISYSKLLYKNGQSLLGYTVVMFKVCISGGRLGSVGSTAKCYKWFVKRSRPRGVSILNTRVADPVRFYLDSDHTSEKIPDPDPAP